MTESTQDRRLLIDDDEPFRSRLAHAMEERGFDVSTAAGVKEATALADEDPPCYAVVDLKMPDGSGLDVVASLRRARPDMRIVVLTGYGSIATAVAAVKVGAPDNLAKPADADEIERALLTVGRP